MSFAVTIDASAFARASGILEAEPARLERELTLVAQRRAKLTKEALQRATPRSHPQGDEPEHEPHMAELWHQGTIGAGETVVWNDAGYAPFLFSGTSSHFVAPVHAPALHFWSGGHSYFSRGHEVSGILPDARLLRALDSQLDKAQDDLFTFGLEHAQGLAARITTEAA